MIIRTIDQGWGQEWPLKQFEKELLDQYLAPVSRDASRTVVINSIWYTDQLHAQTLNELRQLDFDQIVLLATLDCAIPHPEWFAEFDCEVLAVGYYPGANYLDFWALVVDRFFAMPDYAINDPTMIDTAYMCLNRKPHWHRRQVYQQLKDADLLDHGIVSMGGDDEYPPQRILLLDDGQTNIAPNPGPGQHGIANDIASLGHRKNWQRHLLNVVTETVWDVDHHHFVSEKIFKPMLGQRPFVVYDPTGATAWLKHRGFETYYQDFSDIADFDIAPACQQVQFLTNLCAQPKSYWLSKYVALQDKILYNKNRFSEYVTEQQVKIKQGIQCQT